MSVLSQAEFFAKIGLQTTLTDKQRDTLYENYRIVGQYQFHWNRTNGQIDRETMLGRIAYDLQLPTTTIGSRIAQLTKAGHKFPKLIRKSRNGSTINLSMEAFKAIAAMEAMDISADEVESELPSIEV
jgi:hypothetical protein